MTKQIKIWDLATRAFHWLLVISVTMSFVSIKFLHDIELHIKCGALVMALIIFRVLWGLFGSSNAKFTTFVKGLPSVIRYIQLPKESKAQTVGHSPLAGWAVIVMLLGLLVQVGTGLYSDDEIYTTGPLAGSVSSSTSALATEIHYKNSDLLIALIALHLLANLYYQFVLKINLTKPMITGKKKLSDVQSVKERPLAAMACASVAIVTCAYVFLL